MVVYSSWKRTDLSPRRASESQAVFYERIAGPYWDQVRDIIDEWWSHLPSEVRPRLRTRLLDRNSDTNVSSALWELYLHEMLIGSGCTVEVEPSIGTLGKNPDFLVSRGDEQFVVEAIWAVEHINDPAQGALARQLLDAVETVSSPNFYLSVAIKSTGSTAPPQKRLKKELAEWLAVLNPNYVMTRLRQRLPLPRYTWNENGWSLSFEAVPRDPGNRGKPWSGTIGFWPIITTFKSAGSESVFDAVKRKGGKYGDLALPFIVAVANSGLFPESEDIEISLYGKTVEADYRDGRPSVHRLSGGYWNPPRDDRHAQVSGVLVVDNPAPWTWAKNVPILWRSPHEVSLEAPVLPSWATAQLVGANVEHRQASDPVHTVLGLNAEWPIGEAFPRRTT